MVLNTTTQKAMMSSENVTTAAPSPTPGPDFDIPRYIYFYGLSVILPVGIICNMTCFVVFLTSKSMRRTTTGHYLIALAVADSIFLLGELIRWLHSFDNDGPILGITFMNFNAFWCRFTIYMRYAGKLASSWITVAISAERFLTVAFPLKVARISTQFIARIAISLIYVCCFSLGAYPFWTCGLTDFKNSTLCGYTNKDAYENWSMAVLRVGSLLLPSAIIFVFTTLILYYLRKAGKRRQNQFEGQQHKKNAGKSIDSQLTIMLISVAIAFLILRLPYTITYYMNAYKTELWDPLDPWFSYRIYYANKVCDIIAISNYAINFFLYCLSGSAFRTRLRKCVTCNRTW